VTNGTNFTAVFARRKNYVTAGLTYTVRFSGDLFGWDDNTATPTVIADDGEIQAVSIPFPGFLNGDQSGYFQLLISHTP
jgi:hypothetical protein